MSGERWERVKRLVDDALTRSSSDRKRFLDESCAGDDALRAEVESLLRYEQGALLDSATSTGDDLVGRSLGHFRILGELGRGGMGLVYRARDERLGRSVAIKVLPQRFAADSDRRKRFEREARLIAALNHPNVATIHGLDHEGGVHFLILELVAGETLGQRLTGGRLALDEALRLALQVAEALESAHDQGVVHRDLKPSNVMVSGSGAVKVLDFGLAKALRDRPSEEEGSPGSPGFATQEGMVMGTPAYMSPEQVGGIPVDHRTDVWAFGVLLWEMLTGRKLFDGATTAEVLGAVLREELRFDLLPAELPEAARVLLRRCLTRDRRYRLQAIGEARILVERCLSDSRGSGAGRELAGVPAGSPSPSTALRSKPRFAMPLLALCASALLLGAALFFARRGTMPQVPLRKWTFAPPQELNLSSFNADVKLSPNGRYIAYRGDDSLWVLDLEKEKPRRIEDTLNGIDPFWSADSASIGYFGRGAVMTVPVQGGSSSILCQIPAGEPWGASWSPDGEVLVISSGFPASLYEVPRGGGEAKLRLSASETASPGGPPLRSIYRPHFLPAEGGRRVILFAFGSRTALNFMVWDLETGRRKVLGAGALPMYSPSGHVVYQEAGLGYRLWAVPFSLKTLDVTGRPFLVASSGRDAVVSSDGTLAYVDGDLPKKQLTWFDRRGQKVGEVGEPERGVVFPALSPDGKRLIAAAGDDWNFRDAWVYDLGRALRNRLTAAPEDLVNVYSPVWSPSGDEVAFTLSNRDLVLRKADGSGTARTVLTTATYHRVTDWSRDGRYLLYDSRAGVTGSDLRYLERKGAASWEPRDFLATPFAESNSHLSPDGEYVAYVSDESGRDDVYVRPFPSGSHKWLVSSGGGTTPVWSRDGRELFYLDRELRLVTVEVSTRPAFSIGSTRRLFEVSRNAILGFDVSPDGSRFILPTVVGEQPKPVIHVVQNWAAEFVSAE